MNRRALGLGGLIITAVILGGGLLLRPADDDRRQAVTEAEARAHFDKLVAAGQARDFDRLCNELAGATLNCRRILADVGPTTVPSEAPQVLSAVYHPPTDDGEGGWVLTAEGSDARRKQYRTEVLIFRDDEGKLVASNAVYWSSATIEFGDPNGETSPDG